MSFPIRVLVVDDSTLVRKIITDILERDPDIEVVGTANNGKSAIFRNQELNPDVITMDIEMPIMDGYEATKEIRVWEELHSKIPVPIVAQTALTRKEDVSKMLANGFNHHLPKPIEQTSLLDLLKKYSSPF